MSAGEYLAGRLLLAMPGMSDPRFHRAVIAICIHDHNGAFGIDIGRVCDGVRFRDVLADLGIDQQAGADHDVLQGGPVEPGRGFVLHSPDWGDSGTIEVAPLGTLSTSVDVLKAIAVGSGPSRWQFALGYTGWGAGQLEEEMRRHGWYAANGHPQVVYETAASARWAAAWRAEGIDPALLANATGRA